MKALRPGGRFVLQNFSTEQPATNAFGPSNPDHLVRPYELLPRFRPYRIRCYEGVVVNLDEGMHQGPGAAIRLIVEDRAAEQRLGSGHSVRECLERPRVFPAKRPVSALLPGVASCSLPVRILPRPRVRVPGLV